MFVLCPHCQFLVAVDPVSGQPPARCPRCKDALAAPAAIGAVPDPPVQSGQHDPAPAVEADAASTVLPATEPDPAAEPREVPAGLEPSAAAGDSAAVDGAQPIAADATPTAAEGTAAEGAADVDATLVVRRASPRGASALLVAALSLALILQLLIADRAQLAADARWRPALVLLCDVLRCSLPPWHEPTAFTVLDRDVTADPQRPGVLRVVARFRNDARWPQAWPKLVLTLSDADGRVAGERVFVPAEYLGQRATQNALASGQVAAIRMDVIEPAPRIVAFTFDFR